MQIKIHHLLAGLCYSFGRDGLSRIDLTKGYAVTNHLRQTTYNEYDFNISSGDYVCFVLGEPDCRCHLHNHVNETKTGEEIIESMIPKYMAAIQANVDKLNRKFPGPGKELHGHVNVMVNLQHVVGQIFLGDRNVAAFKLVPEAI